jgi:hypothetical protein
VSNDALYCKSTGLHKKDKPTIETGDECHDDAKREERFVDDENLDSRDNIDSKDNIDSRDNIDRKDNIDTKDQLLKKIINKINGF